MGEPAFLDILDETVRVMDGLGLPYCFIGSIAKAAHGEPSTTGDIDVFVREEHAEAALEAFGEVGYETKRDNDQWIYKASRGDTTVDLIFRSSGNVKFDDEMIGSLRRLTFHDRELPVASAEDLIVIFALAHQAATADYWFTALELLARSEVDWEYLLQRSRLGPKRLLSLLVYAESIGLAVPPEVMERMLGSAHVLRVGA
ncbi:MAG TPA: nucleotidyltransferase [Actinomycetota bacterium]|nr:nucleotidyltransferase [Actinomycetota bacterium]